MLHVRHYDKQTPQGIEVKPEQISDYLQNDDGLVWVDAVEPTEDDLKILTTEFHVHPLAIEDIQAREQRPKIIDYNDHIFFVAHELKPVENIQNSKGECVEKGAELFLLVGKNYLISTHYGPSAGLKTAMSRWVRNKDQQSLGAYYLLYLVLDSIVDDYFPALDSFDERVSDLEDAITLPKRLDATSANTTDRSALSQLIVLRRNLIMMRRAVTPFRDAVNILLRHVENVEEAPVAEGDASARRKAERARSLYVFFQDVYDHAIRIVDSIDTFRDVLSSLVDADLAVASNRLNEIVKVMTSVSIILMSVTTVTGIYGMNFERMPELHWKYGYEYAILLMIVIGLAQWRYFRNRHWL